MLAAVAGNDVDNSTSTSASTRSATAPAGSRGNGTYAAALVMELLVILARSPKLTRQLERAGTIPTVVAWLEPVADSKLDTTTRSSLVQNALIVLASMVRVSGEQDGE